MANTKKYWKGIDELNETKSFQESKESEFSQSNSIESFLADDQLSESSTGRRDFLKFLGFSVAAATVAACEAPVIKAVPYVMKPENVTPGMPTWYASTYYDGSSYASILVKTREARPIFIKGNKHFGITKGSVTPPIIASVLGVYDSERIKTPLKAGKKSSWTAVDKEISSAIRNGNKVALISSTVISPSTLSAISELGSAVKGEFEHIQYDAISYSAMRNANELNFGKPFIPSYDFSKAKTIVSINADFLSTWLMPTEFAAQYGETRNPESEGGWMSKHFQFESVMSVAGSNADYRTMTKPSEEEAVLKYILAGLRGMKGTIPSSLKKSADLAIKSLQENGKESLVVCGTNNTGLQQLANEINQLNGANGTTIDLYNELQMFQSEEAKLMNCVKGISSGKYDVVLFYNSNPVYSFPKDELKKALKSKKVKVSVSLNSHADETGALCTYNCPDHHALESWADYQPKSNHYAIAQPTIRPLHDTADALESFLVWSGKAERGGKDSTVAYDKIKETFSNLSGADFKMVMHNSCVDLPQSMIEDSVTFNSVGYAAMPKKPSGTEVIMYQKSAIGSGIHANNPWLHELPDPITKVTWDNYITMNPVEMRKAGYKTTYDQENGLSMAKVTVNGVSVTLPIYPLPGQALGTVGIALGYGRGGNGEKIGKSAYQTAEYGGYAVSKNGKPASIGANVFPMISTDNDEFYYSNSGKLSNVAGEYIIAATQIHHTVMGRHSIVRETTKEIFDSKGKEAYNPAHTLQTLDDDLNHVEKPVSEFDIWDAHPVENVGHRWGMSIDLSSCIGCSNCLVACQSENNVPVVGKDEVRRGREMHWLRIDRYFASDEEAAVGTKKNKDSFSYDQAEIAALNPKVVHMPMMCQHCNHAPCETVCPVAATTHSNEGLNQMTYNRCIGTRYCSNNCPYKVRRFNWFNYPSYKKFTEINPAQDDLGRMVLNPDVTVRSRGVMEKCSFCVQRIQATKLKSKIDKVPVEDGEFSTACADVCPTNAIVVGDWNDVNSKIRKSSENKRSYQALEEVGIRPNVWYKVKVRNEQNNLLSKLQVEKKSHHGSNNKHH
ncbi:MAG: TAT-variant-translocated molybdopterin oxidoreductase [Flavobacteriales bacterium]|nr:TAT-variant-translocated molybdopterin oxidoreductase [Flavobacteriales bacterium]